MLFRSVTVSHSNGTLCLYTLLCGINREQLFDSGLSMSNASILYLANMLSVMIELLPHDKGAEHTMDHEICTIQRELSSFYSSHPTH